MIIIGIRASGLMPFPRLGADSLGRVVTVGGPPAARVAFADALEIVFASLDTAALRVLLARIGFFEDPAELSIEGAPFPDQATFRSPHAPRALLHPQAERRILVHATFGLDPLQYGRLRDLARRDPRLVDALADGPTLELGVGWLFNRAHDALSIAITRLVIGKTSIPVAGAERPPWLDSWLSDLSSRFHRVELPGPASSGESPESRWLEASLSPSPERQRAARALAQGLAEAPFLLPGARPVRWSERCPQVLVGPDLLPLRTQGPLARQALNLAAAVYLSGAEILCFHLPCLYGSQGEAWRAWLRARVEDHGGPLEQVFILGEPGSEAMDPSIDPGEDPDAPATGFGQALSFGAERAGQLPEL